MTRCESCGYEMNGADDHAPGDAHRASMRSMPLRRDHPALADA